jgi:arylformamidase
MKGAALKSGKVDYDLLYNPRVLVHNAQAYFETWVKESERARATLDRYLDVPYGKSPAETMDIFRAEGRSRGLVMFIHGGYWRGFDKKDFSFVAPALVKAGVTVAVVNYSLCPKVEVPDIVMQMVQASAWLHRNGSHFGAPANRLYVVGHSAGGHLTAMMLAALFPAYSPDLPKKVVQGGLSISGIHDLRDMVGFKTINVDVRLNETTALKASPAFMPPATDAPFYTAVGGAENEGFHMQNRLIMKNWKKVHKGDVSCPGDNHFSVLNQLTKAGSPIFRTVLEMVEA